MSICCYTYWAVLIDTICFLRWPSGFCSFVLKKIRYPGVQANVRHVRCPWCHSIVRTKNLCAVEFAAYLIKYDNAVYMEHGAQEGDDDASIVIDGKVVEFAQAKSQESFQNWLARNWISLWWSALVNSLLHRYNHTWMREWRKRFLRYQLKESRMLFWAATATSFLQIQPNVTSTWAADVSTDL